MFLAKEATFIIIRRVNIHCRWGREGKKGGGDECKIEEFQGGEEGEERSKGRGRLFYVEATLGDVTKQRIRALKLKRQN
jgi:hypothetical protein